MDEARVGQKGRTGYRWWLRGERPRGLCDRRFDWAYLYAAVRPASGDGFALVLPEVSTEAMSTFLERFAATIRPDTHAVLVLDQAGWHGSRQLVIPETVSLVPLPAYAPELNPVERLWLHLRERFFSHRILESYDEIVAACCEAWNSLTPERLQSLCGYPWITKVSS
jgi:transposase